MKKLTAVLAPLAAAAIVATPAWAGSSWQASVPFTNQVASSPTAGGGYPAVGGAPVPGNCGPGAFDANHSESWLAVEPGTEDVVGASKFFFGSWSTYYDFYLGAYTIPGGRPAGDAQVQGYDCVSTGTQAMPPSWTNTTDPNVDFDTKGRAYQVMLPFNAYWTNLHPNGAIDVSYSDDLGRTWTKGNGGRDLELSPNSTTLTFGRVEDKQWVAVNHIPDNVNQDHVYAAWAVFNGFTVNVKLAVSRDRGQTFSKPVTLTPPQEVGPAATYVIPSVDAAGNVFVAVTAFPACCSSPATVYVAKSPYWSDGTQWTPFVQVAQTDTVDHLPNTRFRDGITESFAASQTYADHAYVAWEAWDGTQMDVRAAQTVDGGLTWTPLGSGLVNDDGGSTDQFQPQVATGPGGALAIAFYDRRQACPSDKSVLPADVGRTNFCIDTSLQGYRETAAGAVPVGPNVRISKYTWDPEQPGQSVGGLPQYPCAAHTAPCPAGGGFIGDYFGLAISGANVYALQVSTHYPSDVSADGGGRVYYQQQVLATVSRSALGI